MKKGIILLAIGKRWEYGVFSYHMAVSIKHHSPDMPIQLICEAQTIARLNGDMQKIFDIITIIKREDCYKIGEDRFKRETLKLFPALAKLSVFKYAAFQQYIYLDSDGICIKPIDPLFEECPNYFHSQSVGSYNENSETWICQWMPFKNVKKNYPLPKKYTMHELNSSFMAVKLPKAEKFFEQALENMHREVYEYDFGQAWGGSYPDELALNIATAQLKIDPSTKSEVVYFRHSRQSGQDLPLAEITAKHYVIGCYGDWRFNHRSVYSYYDKLLNQYMEGRLDYKISMLMEAKFVLNK